MRGALIASWLAPYMGALFVLATHGIKSKARAVVATLTILVSALASTLGSIEVLGSGEPVHVSYTWVRSLGVTIGVYFDALSSVMALVVSWLSFLIAVYSLEYMEEDPSQTRYWFFFSFFVGSMMLLVLADNFLAMFIGWEGTGLASYSLIGHWFTDEEERWVGDPGRRALGIPMWFEPSHSGLRALVFTRLGDVGMLAGIAVLHALLGTTDFHTVLERAGDWAGELYSAGILRTFLALFVLGALAKSAQIPFHEWLVTAMTGPTSVSALIHAATMVKAGVYFMLRTTPFLIAAQHAVHAHAAVHHIIADFFSCVALIGALTAFVMGTMAVVSRELKLILAFSTASQLGYMFLGTAAGALTGEAIVGVVSGLTHLTSHALFKAALFLSAGAVIHAVHSRFIDDMGGLARHMRATFYATTLAALSLMGLPPFMGFWSKDLVLLAAEESGNTLVLVLGVLAACLTATYTTRMILRVFLYREPHEMHAHPHEPGLCMLVPYTLLAIMCLALGLSWPVLEHGFVHLLSTATLGIEHAEVHLEMNVIMAASTVALALLFAGSTFYLYQVRQVTPYRYVSARPLLRSLHSFLYDRWLINSLYYILIVKGLGRLSKAVYSAWDIGVVDNFYHRGIVRLFERVSDITYRYVDRAGVDDFYHKALPGFFLGSAGTLRATLEEAIDTGYHVRFVRGATSVSNKVRQLQTGLLNHYMLLLWLGFTCLLMLALTLMGWW